MKTISCKDCGKLIMLEYPNDLDIARYDVHDFCKCYEEKK